MRKTGVEEYLHYARQMKIIPNFWLTEAYLKTQKVQTKSNGKGIWVQEDEWAVFPPLPYDDSLFWEKDFPSLIWSDFENFAVGEVLEFLDWEYTYDANAFSDMTGKKWSVFRKNSRKWPRARVWEYTDKLPTNNEVEKLLLKWLEKKPEEVIHDQEAMLWFLFHSPLRQFLYDKNKLMGVNVWDCNEPFLMYRYCIADPDEPFLDEFMRLLFYQRNAAGKLVIDGGVLDNPGLERFKDKLNPVKKRAVYSKRIK
jgi:hypothetical protein